LADRIAQWLRKLPPDRRAPPAHLLHPILHPSPTSNLDVPRPDRRSVASPATCWGTARVAALILHRPSPVQPRRQGPRATGSGSRVSGDPPAIRWSARTLGRGPGPRQPAQSPCSVPPLNPVVWRAQDWGSTAIWNLSDQLAGAPEGP